MKGFFNLLLFSLMMGQVVPPQKLSDRVLDGYIGPVKTVQREWSPLQKTNGINPGTKCRTSTVHYDKQGRESQMSLFSNSCGADESRYTRIYDAEGNFTTREEEFRDPTAPPPPPPPMPPPGVVNRPQVTGPPKAILKYDDKGRKIEKAQYFASGKLSFRIVYLWDDLNRMKEMQAFDADGVMYSRSVYSYAGQKAFPFESQSYGRNGQLFSKTTYSDYELNSRGDWTKRKVTSESERMPKSESLDLRNIEYFK